MVVVEEVVVEEIYSEKGNFSHSNFTEGSVWEGTFNCKVGISLEIHALQVYKSSNVTSFTLWRARAYRVNNS